MPLLLLPLLQLLLFSFSSASASDQHSLLAFKAAITFDPNASFHNWSPNVSFCNWTGVSCSPTMHTVVALNLSGMALEGVISPMLGNLSYLESLDLSGNILLDGLDLNGLLSDYGLQWMMTHTGTAKQLLKVGVLGYQASELTSAKKLSPSYKDDIYAFGVILFDILTGKSAGDIISGNSGAIDLTDWVRLLATEGRGAECFDLLS